MFGCLLLLVVGVLSISFECSGCFACLICWFGLRVFLRDFGGFGFVSFDVVKCLS